MTNTLAALAINGLVWGLIIALIALGLSVIFGLLDIINLAHGDFFMIGTVVAWTVLTTTGSFWPAFVLAPVIGFVLGAIIQRIVLQPIRNAAALSIVATFGLSMILQETVRMTFGPTPRRILPPIRGTFDLFGVEDDRRQTMLDQGLEAITSTTVRAAHDQDWPTKTRVTQLDSLFEQCDAHAVDPRLFERRRDD